MGKGGAETCSCCATASLFSALAAALAASSAFTLASFLRRTIDCARHGVMRVTVAGHRIAGCVVEVMTDAGEGYLNR